MRGSIEKVRQLRKAGENEIADRLEKQIAEGRVKGMVVKTATSGADAFNPIAEIKDWSQIGEKTW